MTAVLRAKGWGWEDIGLAAGLSCALYAFVTDLLGKIWSDRLPGVPWMATVAGATGLLLFVPSFIETSDTAATDLVVGSQVILKATVSAFLVAFVLFGALAWRRSK